MLNNFTNTLDKIAKKVKDENQKNKTEEFHLVLDNAVSFWCQELDFDYEKINYICQGYKQQNIEHSISYLWKESQTQKKPSETWSLFPNPIDNPLYQKINNLLSQINLNFRTTNMEFIVLIAFVITAVGYCVYLINHSPKQQEQLRQKTNNTSSQTSSQTSTSNTPPSSEQSLLVLVVSASNKSLIDSLREKIDKEKIDKENSEKLYDATQYLRQDTKNKLLPKLTNLNNINNQFKAEEPSEYDIYLITIELNQADDRFKPNVNQLDRYDAFINLYADAKIQEISPRLQIEAYENLDVYSR